MIKFFNIFFILILLIAGQFLPLRSQVILDSIQTDDTIKIVFIDDNPIVSMIDSLIFVNYWQQADFINDTNNSYTISEFYIDSIPYFDDSVYAKRIAQLASQTPLPLVFNKYVKAYIELYTVKKRVKTCKIMGLSKLYFPLFEEMLDKYDLPLELKYLAIIESALNPLARSRSGAMGLWQFMYKTGKLYDLNITSYIDERCDPYKSTIAACEYLKFLYSIYKDWNLVLASYNAGPGTVNKAIRRAKGQMDYWKLFPYLPAETRGYVPAFIAANYFMNYSKEHNLHPLNPPFFYYQIDTIMLKHPVSFEQISAVLSLPIEVIRYLNPSYRRDVIPYISNYNILILPKNKIADFIYNEQQIYFYGEDTTKKDSLIVENIDIIHTVKHGEYLIKIANQYHCTVEDIIAWNNLKSKTLRIGQELIIRQTAISHQSSVISHQSANQHKNNKLEYIYYTIKKGDTLWSIASRYEGVTVAELKEWNNISDASKLSPGMRIKIKVE